MQNIAQGWLVYRLTNSELLLGLVTFSSLLATLIFGPFGGAIADKFNKRIILISTQIGSAVLTFIMAILAFNGLASIQIMIVLVFLIGIFSAIDVPTRQAIMIDLVGKDDLINTISLNSMMFNIARTIGPIIATILIHRYNEAICFLINSLSFLPIIFALLKMNIPNKKSATSTVDNFNYRLAFNFIVQNKPIFYTLLIAALTTFFFTPYQSFLTVFASKYFSNGILTLGWLSGALGLGTLTASIVMVVRSKVGHAEHRIAFFSVVYGVILIAFSFTTNLNLAMVMVFISGFCMISAIISVNIYLQHLAPNNLRGRIMAIYVLMTQGVLPFASLLYGWLAEIINIRLVTTIFSILGVIVAIIYYRKATSFYNMRIKQAIN